MTVGPQHEHDRERLVAIFENMPGCIILSNDSGAHGRDGYKFPRTFNGVNSEGVEYIADVYAVMPDDRRVIFEIDLPKGHTHTTAQYNKGRLRDAFFAQFGIAVVHYNKGDAAKLTEAYLMADVNYAFKQLRKALLPTPNPLAVVRV